MMQYLEKRYMPKIKAIFSGLVYRNNEQN
jgi:hypothetical protein